MTYSIAGNGYGKPNSVINGRWEEDIKFATVAA